MSVFRSLLPTAFRPAEIPDGQTLSEFRQPAVNFITHYIQANRKNLPINESALLSKAERETLDNSSTGFVVGGAIPVVLSSILKYRKGVGVIRMVMGVLGATIGSYTAAKNTTDKYIMLIMTTSSDGPMSKGLRNMLFEFAPRSELYKFVQQKLKENGFSEEAWESKDTFAVNDEEAQRWVEENDKIKKEISSNNKVVDDNNSSSKSSSSTVDGKSKVNVLKKAKATLPMEIPVTKDEEVTARRAAYQYFYEQEKRKAGYRYDNDKMSEDDKAKVEEAVIGKLAAYNKEMKQKQKDILKYEFNATEKDPMKRATIYSSSKYNTRDQSKGNASNNDNFDGTDNNGDCNADSAEMNDTVDFLNTFLFDNDNDDSDTESNHRDNAEIDYANTEKNINNLSPIDKWKRIDSFMDYGRTNTNNQSERKTKRNGQHTPKKTTWEEIRARHKFA